MSTEHLVARFYDHPMLNVEESRKAGIAVYDTVLMVELRNRGERGESFSTLVKGADVDKVEYYKAAFPSAWAKYKGGGDGGVISGTAIQLLGLEVGEIQMLEGLEVRSIEDLANLNDTTTQKIRGGLSMKAKAATWLENRKALQSGNVMQELAKMQARIAELEEENSALAEKRRPGRPRKEQDGNTDAQAVM